MILTSNPNPGVSHSSLVLWRRVYRVPIWTLILVFRRALFRLITAIFFFEVNIFFLPFHHSIYHNIGGNGLTVHRPRRRGTFIHFHDATLNNARIFSIDCFSTSNVTYSNDTMTINIQYTWIPGHSYYITLDSGLFFRNQSYLSFMFFLDLGVLTGDEFCGEWIL